MAPAFADSVSDKTDSGLLSSAGELDAFHRGFQDTLEACIRDLSLPPDSRVLDLACGDGAYSGFFLRHLGAGGRVAAVDTDAAFLRRARESVLGALVCQADAGLLPFLSKSQDAVWCAQSFYSLPDPRRVLAEAWRVLKPGGTLAVLEDDSLHQFVFPWPPRLELRIRQAELEALEAETQDAEKFYVGRSLRPLVTEAGFENVRVRAYAATRHSPLGPDVEAFLMSTLKRLERRIRTRLSDEDRNTLARLLDRDSPDWLLGRPDFSMTCLDHVVVAVKPARPPQRPGRAVPDFEARTWA
jgi:ubiquinone/menaquinone biosynthesis C-methylase UbiE